MNYHVPKNRNDLNNILTESGFSTDILPWSDNISSLSEKINIKNKTINNRIVYQPMEGCDGNADGTPGELTIRRYKRFAHGGAGLIWFEATAVRNEARANPRQLYINKSNIDSFKQIVHTVKEICLKENGFEPVVICQLTHSGRYSKPEGVPAPIIAYNNPLFEKDNPISETAIVSDSELREISNDLAHASILCEKAGFDGADIKSCHRYLLSELLSAYTRKGEFGGSFENRTKMLLDTVKAASASVGRDFIITSRLNIFDGFPYPYGFGVKENDNITPDYSEAVDLISLLYKAGLPLINITMGNPYVNPHVNRPFANGTYDPPETPISGVIRMLDGIKTVKKEVPGIKVISSGLSFLGAVSPNITAAMIENGDLDFAGYGRQNFAYPDLAKDITSGNGLNTSKICIACGKCSEIMRAGKTPGCVVRDREVYAEIYKTLNNK